MEYYSAIKKNTFESVLMRWMELEPIIQSEVSQKEKHQYSILLLLLSHFSRVRLCATHRRQPTRLPRPWDSPGKNTGVGCHFLLQPNALLLLLLLLSRFSRVRLYTTPWTAAYQAPPSPGFSRQEHWSGLPFPSLTKCPREVK